MVVPVGRNRSPEATTQSEKCEKEGSMHVQPFRSLPMVREKVVASGWYVRVSICWSRAQVRLPYEHLCLRIIIVVYNWPARLHNTDISGSCIG